MNLFRPPFFVLSQTVAGKPFRLSGSDSGEALMTPDEVSVLRQHKHSERNFVPDIDDKIKKNFDSKAL